MKKFAALIAGIIAITLITIAIIPQQKEAWELEPGEAAYYDFKKNSKRPFLKRIPNNTFFQ